MENSDIGHSSGLTGVTFETMFNGLERNLTSVTKKVVDAENDIVFLSDQVAEKNIENMRKLMRYQNNQ